MCTGLLSPPGAFCTRLLLHSWLLHVGSILHCVHFHLGSASCYTHTLHSGFCYFVFALYLYSYLGTSALRSPGGRLLLQGALLQPSHRILHLIFPPLSLHITFITNLRSIRCWSIFSENNHFPPSSRRKDIFLVDWQPIRDVRYFLSICLNFYVEMNKLQCSSIKWVSVINVSSRFPPQPIGSHPTLAARSAISKSLKNVNNVKIWKYGKYFKLGWKSFAVYHLKLL